MDHSQTTIHTWNKLAAAYQDKFMDFDLYHDTYDTFCQLVEKSNARIFEIGCGPGNITRYILTQRPDYQVEGIDAAPAMVELAQANNPAAHFRTMDCRALDNLHGPFDGILCGFCLPYLSKQESTQLIKDCAALLHPTGIFYFSTIEGDYAHSGEETSSNGEHTLFVYYHQPDYLQEALTSNGFDLITLVRKQYPRADGTASTHLIFISRKS